jgi:hypothetical protein
MWKSNLMFCKLIAGILSLSLLLITPVTSFAAGAPAGDKGAQTVGQSPRKHLTNIVFAGLAGAILGLSTLSFYGRPQDKLSNIAVGFAIGVIGGAMYTTYKAAAEPHEFYSTKNFSPEIWKLSEEASGPHALMARNASMPKAGFKFEF